MRPLTFLIALVLTLPLPATAEDFRARALQASQDLKAAFNAEQLMTYTLRMMPRPVIEAQAKRAGQPSVDDYVKAANEGYAISAASVKLQSVDIATDLALWGETPQRQWALFPVLTQFAADGSLPGKSLCGTFLMTDVDGALMVIKITSSNFTILRNLYPDLPDLIAEPLPCAANIG